MNVKKLTCVVVKFSNSGGQRCLQGDEHNRQTRAEHNRQTRASEQQCKVNHYCENSNHNIIEI